jgi:hypothetical protein
MHERERVTREREKKDLSRIQRMGKRIDTNGDEERDLPLGVQRKCEVEGTATR